MGLVSRVFSLLCARVLPVLVVLIAVFLGWLNHGGIPEGRFFAALIPAMNGVLPPLIVGHGRMKGTPPVPDDKMPEPRPEKEMFLELPGGYQMPAVGLGMCCR